MRYSSGAGRPQPTTIPLPTLVIVGRPNVGKSTLFNRLTRSRAALVADLPGLTRDRHYGQGWLDGKPFLVVDTGGFAPQAKNGIEQEMARQAEAAIAEADALLFVVDGRAGLTAQDRDIVKRLRLIACPLFLVVNKAEGMPREIAAAEFFALGCGAPLAISAAHGDGVRELLEQVIALFEPADRADTVDTAPMTRPRAPRVAIAGRPNVGKSTLINQLLGEQRVIAFDAPGTTRDAIEIPFERAGRSYTLIDTAGLRRRGRVFEAVEKFSVIKTLQAIEAANVVVLMVDARQDISDQDAHIARFCLEAGRALVLAVNKWDALDAYRRERIKAEVGRKLNFLSFAKTHYIAAQSGQGVAGLLKAVDSAYDAAFAKLSTPRITRVLLAAVQQQQPPRSGATRPKLRYAHQGGSNPPLIVVHGNGLQHLTDTYTRYLEHRFVTAFNLSGTPLRVEYKNTRNPFVEK